MHRRIRFAAPAVVALGLIAGALATTGPAGASSTPTGLSAAQVRALSRHVTQSVIVVFKDQVPSLPANTTFGPERQTAVRAIQSQVVGQLRRLHAPDLHSYTLVNAVSATVSPAEEARLAVSPGVAEVVPNATAHLEFTKPTATVSAQALSAGTRAASLPRTSTGSKVCQEEGSPAVELDPQALQTIRANSNVPNAAPTAASLGITGAGVKVAFVAEGIDVTPAELPAGQRFARDHRPGRLHG